MIAKQLCDILIEPPGLGNVSVFDVRNADMLFKRGYDFVVGNFKPDDFKFVKKKANA
jgi:hypothetical protein